ncbi:MAG: hypothetical protein DRN96_01280 [Thermoproteota archaeon]|nr:MAG: hypothetical protein DRN96_01280 [Candidatus Korarchaeota archaeon]RLG56248.1 MAG: hypothetical protein DRN99_00090 [Candidatus Korarchaeota archaeon]
MPPSAQAVLDTLSRGELLSQRDISRETGLPPRTVRYALKRLLEAGMVVEFRKVSDLRVKLYAIADGRRACEGYNRR